MTAVWQGEYWWCSHLANASELAPVMASLPFRLHGHAHQRVWLPAWGFLLVFYSNDSQEMYHCWVMGIKQSQCSSTVGADMITVTYNTAWSQELKISCVVHLTATSDGTRSVSKSAVKLAGNNIHKFWLFVISNLASYQTTRDIINVSILNMKHVVVFLMLKFLKF